MVEKPFRSLLKKFGLYGFTASIHNRYSLMNRKKIYQKMKETGEVPLPKKITFEPTQCCNLRCKMCFFNKNMTIKPNEMTLDEIKRIFDSIKFVKFINMVGGEVMLRKDFFDILEYFKSIGMEIQIGSNGTLINEENAENLKSNPNITAMTFSIDGTRDLHNSIRRTDFAFDNAIRGIKLVNGRIPTYVVTVLMDDNVNQIHDIVRLMNEIKVKNLTFEYERKYSKSELEESAKMMNLPKENIPVSLTKNKEHVYPIELFREKLTECLDLGKKLGVNVGFFPRFLYENLDDCYNETLRANGVYLCKCLFTGRIDPQGNVIHCYAIRKSFGNLFERSFEQIWNSDEMKEFRKTLLNNNLLPICETCLYMERVK